MYTLGGKGLGPITIGANKSKSKKEYIFSV